MIVYIQFHEQRFSADLASPIDISIPIHNGTDNPNCYGSDPVDFETIRSGNFIGSIAEGGSVNHKKLHITPHGNGTHTECYGHIVKTSDTINKCLVNFHWIGQLVTVLPEQQPDGDTIITTDSLLAAVGETKKVPTLIIRTLPNPIGKLNKQYTGSNPPYLSPSAIEWLVERGVQHLLIDLPSVDREIDGGRVLSHHTFWNTPGKIRREATITELIYVPSEIPDGLYLVNLQIISLEMDASPSKPVLYKLTEVS